MHRFSIDLLVGLLGGSNINIALCVVTFLLHLSTSLFTPNVLSASVIVLGVGTPLNYSMAKVCSTFRCSLYSLGLDYLSVVDSCTYCIIHNFFIGIDIVILLVGND